SPVWSPAGDAIAFLRLDGEIADLVEVKLNGSPGSWTKGDETPLTEVSGLDRAVTPAADATGSVATATSYLARLAARSAATGTVLCLGVDPDPAALPP